jgi:hypothetical protein
MWANTATSFITTASIPCPRTEGAWSIPTVAHVAPSAPGIVGAIAVVGPAFRCDEAWRTRTGRLLQAAARTINDELAEDHFQHGGTSVSPCG